MTSLDKSATRYGALSRAAIVAAARTVADTDGLGSVTLRRVADDLGTGQASLYRHITSRAELLALLADDLAAGFPRLPTTSSAEQTVLRQWRAIHRYLAEHPWGAHVIAAGDQTSTSATMLTDHVLHQLRELGLSHATALRAYRAFFHLLLGHLLNDHPLGHGHARADPARRSDEADFTWALRRLLAGVQRA